MMSCREFGETSPRDQVDVPQSVPLTEQNVASLTLSGLLLWFMQLQLRVKVADGFLAGGGWSSSQKMTELRERKRSGELHLNYYGYFFSPENEDRSENSRVFPGCPACSATSLVSWL